MTLFFLAFFLLIPAVSLAGGLYINEFGTPSMGVAGANAVADDASTSFHNAAGMTRIEGKELMGTGGVLYSTATFEPDNDTPILGGDGGNAGSLAPIAGGFYVHSLSILMTGHPTCQSIAKSVMPPELNINGVIDYLQAPSLFMPTTVGQK